MTNAGELRDMAEEKKVDVDEVLMKFHLLQRYYIQTFLLVFLGFLSNGFYSNNFIFVAGQVGYRCKDADFVANSCTDPLNASLVCQEWEYDDPESFVAQFELACQEWKRTLVGTMHSAGNMCGLLLVGPMSDRIGRKKMVAITGVLGGILGAARSFTNSYVVYLILAFAESAVGDIYSPLFVLSLEMVPTNGRLLFNLLASSGGYSSGNLFLPLVAWLVPYWRHLLLVIYTPAIMFFFYVFLLDESPRWLISKGKKDEAVALVKKIAKKNRVKLDKDLLDHLTYEEVKGVPFEELLKSTFGSSTLLKRFFICLIWWVTSTFVSYGISINSVSLQGNKYVNYAVVHLVDLPGTFIVLCMLKRFKRKKPLMFFFFAAAALCFMQPFLSNDLPWLSILVTGLSRLTSGAFFNITYIFTSELFPTYTRNSMHGLCSSLGRVGSILAPQTPLLMQYWVGLPSLVFGSASLIAGMVTTLVPDSADAVLPNTVTQAEELSDNDKPDKPHRTFDEPIH